MTLEENLKKILGPSRDYIFKNIKLYNQNILLIFNETLTNSIDINDFILKPLFKLKRKDLNHLEDHLPTANIKSISTSNILDNLFQGFVIIITKTNIYAAELRASLDRGIQTIESELSIIGPKDSFSENYNTNLGLIRKRLKTPDLYVENMSIGTISKTKIGIVYLNNIARQDIVEGIKAHLEKINIDGIIDSSYLKRVLEKRKNLFPTLTITERPDKVSMALLEGKVAIITDMSPYVIILPSFLIDFFHTTDDYYQKSLNTSFIRIIRLFAFLVAVFTPAIYIFVTTRNYNLIPLDLLMTLKAGRTFVPFPAYIEALFMIICFEILKESDLRMSSTTGSAVSILGGLILGDAAVSAGIVSPIMIIVIAISSIAGLTFQSMELSNALRAYKILLLILSTILGINGFLIGTTILIYHLLNLKVFGIPYLNPFIPYEKNEIKDAIIKSNRKEEYRNSQITKNTKRGNY